MQQTARPDYAQVGLLKTALTASSTAFQIPMALLAERFGEVAMLAMGMAWVGAGFMVLGLAGSFVHTLLLMVVAGTGGSVQHPVASSFISREYEGRRRGSALGILNVAGDLGKFIIPLVFALSLTAYGWRVSLVGLGVVSFVFALAFWYLLRDKDRGVNSPEQPDRPASTQGCGILADKLGTTRMIVFTETMTGALILLLLPVGQWTMLPLLFCVGFFLNGTSHPCCSTAWRSCSTPPSARGAMAFISRSTSGPVPSDPLHTAPSTRPGAYPWAFSPWPWPLWQFFP